MCWWRWSGRKRRLRTRECRAGHARRTPPLGPPPVATPGPSRRSLPGPARHCVTHAGLLGTCVSRPPMPPVAAALGPAAAAAGAGAGAAAARHPCCPSGRAVGSWARTQHRHQTVAEWGCCGTRSHPPPGSDRPRPTPAACPSCPPTTWDQGTRCVWARALVCELHQHAQENALHRPCSQGQQLKTLGHSRLRT